MKRKKLFIKIIISVCAVLLLLVLLRATHIIINVGGKYTLCFSKKYIVDTDRDINDNNIQEIAYMKNLQHFSAIDTDLSNINFITEFNNLKSLNYVGHIDNPKSILKEIPSLENSPNLEYVYLFNVDVQNLNFLKESYSIEYITVVTQSTDIVDISALQNKKKLKTLQLENVLCDDYSVLLELTSLKSLNLVGDTLPFDIKEELINRGVKITEK